RRPTGVAMRRSACASGRPLDDHRHHLGVGGDERRCYRLDRRGGLHPFCGGEHGSPPVKRAAASTPTVAGDRARSVTGVPKYLACGSTTTVLSVPCLASTLRARSANEILSGPPMLTTPLSGDFTATRATSAATSSAAIGWISASGARTSSPASSDP